MKRRTQSPAAPRGSDSNAPFVRAPDASKGSKARTDIADKVLTVPHDEAEQYHIKTAFTRELPQFYPEAANEIRDKAHEEGLRQSIVLVLATRQLELTDALRAQIEAESRVEVLQRWLTRRHRRAHRRRVRGLKRARP